MSKRSAISLVAFPTIYALSVLAGRATLLEGGEVALVWPAAAVGVIWLLSTRRAPLPQRVVHVGLLAAVVFTVNVATGAATSLSLWFVLVNVALCVMTVEVLTYRRDEVRLRDPADFAHLVVAVAAGAGIAAAMAAAILAVIRQASVWETFALFSVRNGATALLALSVWLSLTSGAPMWRRPTAASVGEAALVGCGITALFYWALWMNADLPLAFVTLLPAMWVALRYNTTVSTVFLLAAGIWIIVATLSGRGVPVADVPIRVMLAQAMVFSLTLVVMTLSLYRDSRARLISELEEARDRADHVASHDPLTGLANRALFTDTVERALVQAVDGASVGVGVILLDLDGFKAVNDTWGHAEGDEVLVEVSTRIEAAIRPTDTVARLGGDEFAVLCPGTVDVVRLKAIAERLRAELRQPITLGVGETYDRLSVSVGVVTSRGGRDVEMLLKRADTFMYHAKRNGKDCVSVESPVDDGDL